MNAGTISMRILVVDDHAILRQGLRMLVEAEPGFEIVGEAESGAAALALAASTQPDIVVLDIDLGTDNGLDLIAGLQAAAPASRILILTGLRDVEAGEGCPTYIMSEIFRSKPDLQHVAKAECNAVNRKWVTSTEERKPDASPAGQPPVDAGGTIASTSLDARRGTPAPPPPRP